MHGLCMHDDSSEDDALAYGGAQVRTMEDNAHFTPLLQRLVDEHGAWTLRNKLYSSCYSTVFCVPPYLVTPTRDRHSMHGVCRAASQKLLKFYQIKCWQALPHACSATLRWTPVAESVPPLLSDLLCTVSTLPGLLRAAPMLDALAAGLRECSSKPFVGAKLQLDAFLDNMLRSRISRRVIAEQHIHLANRRCEPRISFRSTFD